MKGLSWGVDVLDRVLGNLQGGRLYVIGARPSCGKTAFSLFWIDHHIRTVEREFNQTAGSGKRFWDMPRRLSVFLTERSPAVARLSWAAMRLGYDLDSTTAEDWRELPKGAEESVGRELEWIEYIENKQGWITFFDLALPTVEGVRNALADKVSVSGAGPQAILFDFIQRIQPSGRESGFAAISEAAHFFQRTAIEHRIPVLITSQLKRKGDEVFDKYRPPNLEDYKMSGNIEESADVALGFFRPLVRMTVQDEREVRAGRMGLDQFKVLDVMAVKCVKHRWQNPANDQVLWVRHSDGRIGDMPAPQHNTGDAWEPDDSTPF